MRFVVFFLALCLVFCAVKARLDDDDNRPGQICDVDDDDCYPDDNDRPGRPTTTLRPNSTRQPGSNSARKPTPTTLAARTVDPEDTPEPTPTGVNNFNNATVYQPDDVTHHLTSPRTESLGNKTLLIVWNDSAQQNGLPVYRSSDDGFSWYSQGTAQSETSGRQLLEPHLLYINGTWSGETNPVLLAVNAVDSNSTNIELYYSTTSGVSWEFAARIAEGGPVGAKAVGEPHLVFHDNRVTVLYSDSRDSTNARKVSQQSTNDLSDTWDTATNVAVSTVVSDQQGSASVAQLPNTQYIIVTESSNNSTSKVQYQLTSNVETAATGNPQDIVTSTGVKLQSAPFITWLSLGGTNGTLVLSDSVSSSVFINEALGQGIWKEVSTVAGRAYGREVKANPNDKRSLRITGGSEGNASSSDILTNVFDFEKMLASAK